MARKPIAMSQLFSEAGQSHQIHQLKGRIEELETEITQMRTGTLDAAEKASLERQIEELRGRLAASGGIREVELNEIEPDPEQPRKSFPQHQIQERAENLQRKGQKSPIVLISQPNGKHILFDGELRWRAARSLGWKTLKAVFLPKEQIEREAIFEGQLVTSIHSQKLHDLDLAEALIELATHKYPDLKGQEADIPKILNAAITQLRREQKHLELNEIRLADEKTQQQWLDTAGFRRVEEQEIIATLLDLQLNPISINNNIFPLLILAEDLKQVVRREGIESSKAKELNKLSAAQLQVDEEKALAIRTEVTQKTVLEKLSLNEVKRLVNQTLTQHCPKKPNRTSQIAQFSKTVREFEIQTADREELLSLQQILSKKLTEIQRVLEE
jgi:ParB family chromosome partitioning protein